MEKFRKFYLNKKDDCAVVKLLHTSVSTIESEKTHLITIDERKKSIKCLGNECPFCIASQPKEQIYIHLYDFTDNTYKVWARSPKVLPQLEELEKEWGPLNDIIVKITRLTDEFPRYSVVMQNAKNFIVDTPEDEIDAKVAKFNFLSRKMDECMQFCKTGKFPERAPFVPREQYLANKANNNNDNEDTPF